MKCQISNGILPEAAQTNFEGIDQNERVTKSARSARSAKTARLLPGTIIAEHHELVSVAGQGGMSTVYRANDIWMERQVAVKCLDPFLINDDESNARFKQEAQVLATLKHDNIAKFYSFGVLPSSLPYLVMEWLEGETLTQVLKNSGALSAEKAIKITMQIADALDHAHKAGIIHRDLKPGNIMLVANDRINGEAGEPNVKIIDFGIACIQAESGKITTKGSILGTPDYFSPEQGLGLSVDARSDVYALGCILFEMICGRTPFIADHPVGMICQHINNEVPKPSQLADEVLPKGLEAIIQKCLAKNPNNRFQSMQDLYEALSKVLNAQKKEVSGGRIKLEQRFTGKSLDQIFFRSAACLALVLTAALGCIVKHEFLSPSHSTSMAKVSRVAQTSSSLI